LPAKKICLCPRVFYQVEEPLEGREKKKKKSTTGKNMSQLPRAVPLFVLSARMEKKIHLKGEGGKKGGKNLFLAESWRLRSDSLLYPTCNIKVAQEKGKKKGREVEPTALNFEQDGRTGIFCSWWTLYCRKRKGEKEKKKKRYGEAYPLTQYSMYGKGAQSGHSIKFCARFESRGKRGEKGKKEREF